MLCNDYIIFTVHFGVMVFMKDFFVIVGTLYGYCIASNYGRSSWSCLVVRGRAHYNKIKCLLLNICWMQTFSNSSVERGLPIFQA